MKCLSSTIEQISLNPRLSQCLLPAKCGCSVWSVDPWFQESLESEK